MDHRNLHVLIVSRMGAHQKAIQAMCASIPQFGVIETVNNTQQALERIQKQLPNLLILGANLAESQVCDLLCKIKRAPDPPYCVVLTHSEVGSCLDQHLAADQIVSTGSFANRLPEILNEVFVQ